MNDFTVGGTLRLTVRLIARNAGALAILALLSVGVAALVGQLVRANLAGSWQGWLFLPVVLTYLVSIFLHVAVIHTVISGETDLMARVGSGFALALRLFFPVLAISLLFGIATALAAILLIFPAFMLYCRWILAVPTSVIERCGIFESFRRSAALTKGSRWRIFGLMLIAAVIGGLVTGGVALIEAEGVGLLVSPWLLAILNGLRDGLTGVIFTAGAVAIYLELRRTQEGVLSPDLVAVFD